MVTDKGLMSLSGEIIKPDIKNLLQSQEITKDTSILDMQCFDDFIVHHNDNTINF